MSRIVRAAVNDGDTLDAASLNDRFSDYTQTDLNAFNHRDAAHDLPQFAKVWLQTYQQQVTLGLNDWKHGSTVSVSGMTAMPAAAHPIEDGAGNPTDMSFGAGLTISPGEVLRVYWNLSVKPDDGTNWNTAGSLAYYDFNNGSGGAQPTSTWGACWVFYLEWDITSSARTNYVPVVGQSDFTTVIGGKYGNALSICEASSVVPADLRMAAPNQGNVPIASETGNLEWRGVSGAWYYPRTGSDLTIYGLRLVVKGVMHPWHVGTTNYLVHDTTFSTDAALEYNGGNLAVIKQRMA